MMKMQPILFTTEMVKAILEGRKSQTRRVVKNMPDWVASAQVSIDGGICQIFDATSEGTNFRIPPYRAKDRLWVREAFAYVPRPSYGPRCKMSPDGKQGITFKADWQGNPSGFHWKPSIHMPRWAARIILEVTKVRVERLNDISEADAQAEGALNAHQHSAAIVSGVNRNVGFNWVTLDIRALPSPETDSAIPFFRQKWDEINGKRFPWASNPWVWIVEFKRVTI